MPRVVLLKSSSKAGRSTLVLRVLAARDDDQIRFERRRLHRVVRSRQVDREPVVRGPDVADLVQRNRPDASLLEALPELLAEIFW